MQYSFDGEYCLNGRGLHILPPGFELGSSDPQVDAIPNESSLPVGKPKTYNEGKTMKQFFEMAAMPFPCNGLMLYCVN